MSNNDNLQKISNQNHVPGSLYINHMKSIFTITNTTNEGKTYSYERRLQKLKGMDYSDKCTKNTPKRR